MRYCRALSEVVLPERCPACGDVVQAETVFCPACALSLVEIEHACPKCGAPTTERTRCRPCQSNPFPFRRARAYAEYGGQLAVAIRRLKSGGGGRVARSLARLLSAPAAGLLQEVDILVPVPLHPRRLRRRGYNQAALLVGLLARGQAISYGALRRRRDTRHQAGLTRAERLQNLERAFQVQRSQAVADKRVLLVDDVMTSGATAVACTNALLAAGASAVDVLTVARASL